MPERSNACCQASNSSSDMWYRRHASSIVSMPLDTADTTAALRRATHRRVFVGGSSIIAGFMPDRWA